MTATVRDLVAHEPLGLTLLTSGFDGLEIGWSHSSDLADPSPFLEPGQLLLTTGRQFATFADRSSYDAYVGRLARAGAVAIGFGTEVVEAGTPRHLVDACEAAALALIEVPYATPFIAVSRFIADRHAAESRRRIEWALQAQEAVSKAVLSSGGLRAAVATAAEALQGDVAVLDSEGLVVHGAAPHSLRERARVLLKHGTRARDEGRDDSGHWVVNTLGRTGALVGATVIGRPGPQGTADRSVETLLTALTELSLEHAEDQRLGFRSIAPHLLRLLLDGRIDSVGEALGHYSIALPRTPVVVFALPLDGVPSALRDSLERMSASPGVRLFAVQSDDGLLVLTDQRSRRTVADRITEDRVSAGIATADRWADLADATKQSRAALNGARAGEIRSFDDLRRGSVLGLLAENRVAELARLRTAALLRSDDGPALLREAAVWLRHDASWERAARDLNLHRHTLKQRMTALGQELGLPVDEFRGRAELWALLVALDLARS
ncbi:PucR family transcriptional regulator [Rathayibacter sp. VKM Ac-2805]|uniref:PucR family transcriptional regulator n=1 Tax=Rathayibacter sp. VKM Ac-2805 TaxID=2609258 RepID=UPI00131F4E0E|nr:PucR family transcriptional regulator [Rathayibacter sp. VKM Ac-2805]QHC75113.1 PucR family transcriptional regulator [Rathayibacter sp. VKM Ac-2805]